MKTGDAFNFILLAALWGASFLFMRVAAPEFGPFALMLMRCAIGALVLGADLRGSWQAESFDACLAADWHRRRD